jgi:hypothetical protein
MKYTEYDPGTGQIMNILYVPQDQLPPNLHQMPWIEGEWDGNKHYVDHQQIKDLPADPSTHMVKYSMDWSTKTWHVNVKTTEKIARQTRNSLLYQLDRMNPVWWAELTSQQQDELKIYRQALLDVPQQAGFPINTEWPTKPTWL